MLLGGIDPGIDGGLCILDEHACIVYLGLLRNCVPKDVFAKYGVTTVWIEKAQPMGKESSKAMFNYGRNYGFLLGTLDSAHIDVRFVPPAIWTGVLHDRSAVATEHKKAASEYVAKRIWPHESFLATPRSRKAHDGLFEAALIAYYGLLKLGYLRPNKNHPQQQSQQDQNCAT